jgi:general secretion pathway protein B
MSYILDALRRADRDRQTLEPHVPAFRADPGPAPSTRRPRSRATTFVLLAAVGLVAAAWFWSRPTPLPVTQPEPETAAPSTAAPARSSTSSGAEVVPLLATQEEAVDNPPKPTENRHRLSSRAVATVALPVAPAERETPPEQARSSTTETPPRSTGERRQTAATLPPTDWHDLPMETRKRLTRPRLDVHVYDADPGRRFVLVGFKKYREGDQLPNGSTLEQITADGLVLDLRGERYRVPRR